MVKTRFVVWHFTNLCDLHCDYCSQDAGEKLKDELSLDKKLQLVEEISLIQPRMLAFTGGEAVLSNDFWPVLDKSSKLVKQCCVGTNGYALKDDILNKLQDHDVRIINASINGSYAELNDSIRGRKGNFNQVTEGIKRAVDKGMFIELSMMVSKKNYHDVDNVINLGKSLGVREIELIDYRMVGRSKNDKTNALSDDEIFNLMNKIDYDNSKTRIWCFEARFPKYRIAHKNLSDERSTGCDAGYGMVIIQPNGIVTPCTFLPDVKIGDVRETPLREILDNSEVLLKLADRNNLEGKCGSCIIKEECGGCRSRAYAFDNNLFGEDRVCMSIDYIKNGTKNI